MLSRAKVIAGLLFAWITCPFALSANFTTERTLDVDLEARIAESAPKADRFAVDVPHAASLTDSGQWERSLGTSTWRYSLRIPGAVSLSFHARELRLPAGATLTVTGRAGVPMRYTGATGKELWSGIARGDALKFEVHDATSDEASTVFAIASLQAGYRVLGGGRQDHPAYRKALGLAADATAAVCLENFACHANAENSLNADGTAAIVIGGVALCSATLINNLRNDGTPYLLTARHCQAGSASSVTVYWDASVACGQSLADVYESAQAATSYSFTETAFEQQDVWLLKLGTPPSSARPYFVGWDATGGVLVGGYSPHHALGRSRQYVHWFGQSSYQTMSRDVLGIGYDSSFWGVVNDVGSVGSGASGGGLFDANNRLVGVGSLAYLQDGPGSDGVCPVSSPPTPSVSTATALYTALSAVWDTNADTTSFTNPVTLKSLLDPDSTGLRVSNGLAMLQNMTLTVSHEVGKTGWQEKLEWNAPAAGSCVASGGVTGDGWAGNKPASGSLSLTQYESSVTNYTIRCADGQRFSQRTVQIVWIHEPPIVVMQTADGNFRQIVGDRMRLRFASNVQPCVATGGATGDGWTGVLSPAYEGVKEVTFTRGGMIRWTLTCGTGARTATQDFALDIFPVAAQLGATGNNLRVNTPVRVFASMATGLSCTKSGGAPGDGWAGPFSFGGDDRTYTSTLAGTFRYVLTCQSGAISATSFVDVTFTNAPPSASLTTNRTNAFVYPSTRPEPNAPYPHPNAIKLSWVSNLSPCTIDRDGPGTDEDGPLLDFDQRQWSTSSVYDLRSQPGAYVYTLSCGSDATVATSQVTVNWQPNGPAVKLYLPNGPIVSHEEYFMWWYGNVQPCTSSGGTPGDGWARSNALATAFSSFTAGEPGTYHYTVSCSNGIDTVQSTVDIVVPPNAVNFQPHPAEARVGESVWLSWHATTKPCAATGDWPAVPISTGSGSSVQVGSPTTGLRTYTIRCGTAETSTTIRWLEARSVDITANALDVPVGQPVTLQWTTANVSNCTVGRDPAAEWFGSLPDSGTRSITRSTPGSQTFWIDCDGVFDFVSVTWVRVDRGSEPFEGPTVSLTADSTNKVVGDTLKLTWTTTRASGCHVSQSPNGSGWVGNIAVSGTQQFQMSSSGTYLFGIECTGAPPRANAQVSVTVANAPAPPAGGGGSAGGGGAAAGGSGGGGGGGQMDPALLAFCALLLMFSAQIRRRRAVPTSVLTE